MATNFNLLRANRQYQDGPLQPPAFDTSDADHVRDPPFLSERGKILIACVLFCTFVWSTLFLWLFG